MRWLSETVQTWEDGRRILKPPVNKRKGGPHTRSFQRKRAIEAKGTKEDACMKKRVVTCVKYCQKHI